MHRQRVVQRVVDHGYLIEQRKETPSFPTLESISRQRVKLGHVNKSLLVDGCKAFVVVVDSERSSARVTSREQALSPSENGLKSEW